MPVRTQGSPLALAVVAQHEEVAHRVPCSRMQQCLGAEAGPLCAPAAQIQVLRPVHWLHPRAVMLTALYESLTSDPAIRGHIPPRLRDLLEFHRTLIRYTDEPAASGSTHAHEQARGGLHRASLSVHAPCNPCRPQASTTPPASIHAHADVQPAMR